MGWDASNKNVPPLKMMQKKRFEVLICYSVCKTESL